jgi:CheY-like chemotaxis protein
MTVSTDGRGRFVRADQTAPKVLVVDDEPSLAELLSMALRYEGWEVRSAGDGTGAVRTARDFRPDAVVLDMMLPDIDGLEVLRRLRSDTPDVPVLFLTAKDSVEDRVTGLTAGGDDYVTKPFSLEEVVARLRGLMRRAKRSDPRDESTLMVGDLMMDEDSREVSRGADRDRVRAAALPDAQRPPGAVQEPDPGPGVALRLRGAGQRGRALYLIPAKEGRRRPQADDSHDARRRLCSQAYGIEAGRCGRGSWRRCWPC